MGNTDDELTMESSLHHSTAELLTLASRSHILDADPASHRENV